MVKCGPSDHNYKAIVKWLQVNKSLEKTEVILVCQNEHFEDVILTSEGGRFCLKTVQNLGIMSESTLLVEEEASAIFHFQFA